METRSDCLFCKIVAGTIPSQQVYSDDNVIVFKDIHPKAPVHLLVVPREHIDSLKTAKPEHQALLGDMLLLLPKLAEDQGLHDGFKTIINTDPAGGQMIYHLHIHLLGGQQFSE